MTQTPGLGLHILSFSQKGTHRFRAVFVSANLRAFKTSLPLYAPKFSRPQAESLVKAAPLQGLPFHHSVSDMLAPP